MATNAGSVFVELQARIGKFTANIKTAQGRLKKFGTDTRTFVNQNSLAIAGSVAGIGAILFKVTKAASALEETQAKFDTVFRGSTKEAENFATELQDNYLLSEEAAKRFLGGIQDTLVPMGIAREAATGLSANIIKLAADLGSFNNIDTETVVRDLQSALVGNTETVKKYGIVLRATDIEQRAMVDTGKTLASTLTQAEKVQASYNIILEGSSDAQGDVARTSESFANRMKKLQATFQDLMATVGQFTIGPATDLVEWLSEVSEDIGSAIKTIQEATTQFGNFGTVIKGTLIEALRGLVNGILEFIETSPAISAVLSLLGVDVDGVKEKLNSQIDTWQATSQAAAISAEQTRLAEQTKKEVVQETSAEIIKTDTLTAKQIIANRKAEKKAADKANKEKVKSDKIAARERVKAEKQARDEIIAIDKAFFEIIAEDNRIWADERQRSQDEWRDTFTTSTEEMGNFAREQFGQIFDSFGGGVADMILEGRKFSDVIKEIWKDLARNVIAMIAKMIAKWLVFQAITAAGGGGAGGITRFLAHGGIISEPSVVTGLRSGVKTMIGEAGDEAVIPVGSLKSRGQNQEGLGAIANQLQPQEAAGGGDGMNITLNFNIRGKFIEGNERKWQTLIRDKVVPKLRRFTMSQPVGLFQRRRGAA